MLVYFRIKVQEVLDMPHPLRTIVLGIAFGLGVAVVLQFVWYPEVAVAWGNGWAAREQRLAAQEAREAEQEKAEAIQRVADEDYNEAHCKVTINTSLWGTVPEVVTGVRGIRPMPRSGSGDYMYIRFGGGVERAVRILKTEDCR